VLLRAEALLDRHMGWRVAQCNGGKHEDCGRVWSWGHGIPCPRQRGVAYYDGTCYCVSPSGGVDEADKGWSGCVDD
jgi:hypothetical protein